MQLESLTLLLPDRTVVDILAACVLQLPALTSLSLISRDATIIGNDFAEALCAGAKTGLILSSLTLIGCRRLTDEPLVALIKKLPRLSSLALEACSSISTGFFETAAPYLPNLQLFRTTYPSSRTLQPSTFFGALLAMIRRCEKLHSLSLYHSGHYIHQGGSIEFPVLSSQFVAGLVQVRGQQLRKLEVHGILVSLDALELACVPSSPIQHLVLHLWSKGLPRWKRALANLRCLETLHIMLQQVDVTVTDLQELVEACGPHLRQIGIRNRCD